MPTYGGKVMPVIVRCSLAIFLAIAGVGCNENSSFPSLSGTGSTSPKSADIVATVNNKDITAEQLKLEINSTLGGMLRAKQPGGYESLLVRLIDSLIVEKEATRRNIHVKPKYVSQVEVIQAKADREKRELLQRMLFEEFSSENKIDAKEVEAYYESNKKRFLTASLQLNRIVVDTEKDAKSALSKINKGQSFNKLAGEINVIPELKQSKGSMGVLMRAEIPRSLRAAAFGLKEKTEISSPFKTEGKWNLLQLVNKETGVVRPFRNVNKLLEKELRLKRTSSNFKDFISAEKKSLNVTINHEALVKLGPPKVVRKRVVSVPHLSRSKTGSKENIGNEDAPVH